MKKIILFITLFALVFSLPTQGVSAQGSDSSAFISESAPYDNAQIQPGASFIKSWTLQNKGSTTWTTGYTFTLIEGAAMGPTSVNLTKEVKPGETINIVLNMTAPIYGGSVINRYQLKNSNGALFGAKPYVLINVSAQVQPSPAPGQQIVPQVGGPNLVTLNMNNNGQQVQVQATQPPPGGAYVPFGNSSFVSVSKMVCTEKSFLFYKWTACETQTVPFELPTTPTSTETNVTTSWQGNAYQGTFYALAPAMSMSLAAQGSASGTITVVSSSAPLAAGGITSASAATFITAAAPVVLVGVLVCGGIVLMYYAQATALPYTGPAVTTSSETLASSDLFFESHTTDDHNPNKKNSLAYLVWIPTFMSTYASFGGGHDPNNFKCGVIKVAGQIIRAAIWMRTDQFISMIHTQGTPGLSVSYFVNSTRGPWVGSYPKTGEAFQSYQPSSAETAKGWQWEPMNCDDPNFPQPPTMLNAAQ